ncbi:MAG: hypothetical protein M1820_006758 [Bogoriella megaspora]|nr:MAG: hypothetical protein M1820_006758 [Bogoriella megaspora]
MPRNENLSLNISKSQQRANGKENTQSPRSPRSPANSYTPSTSPSNFIEAQNGSTSPNPEDFKPPKMPAASETPQSPSSPSRDHARSKSFFTLTKASKSSTRLPPGDPTIRQVSEERIPEPPKHSIYLHNRGSGSTPELASMTNLNGESINSSSHQPIRQDPGKTSKSSSAPYINPDGPIPSQSKRHHTKPRFNILRSRSIRTDDATINGINRAKASSPSTPINIKDTDRSGSNSVQDSTGLRTAPIDKQDQGFKEMMESSRRNRSAERYTAADSEDDSSQMRSKRDALGGLSSSFKEGSGAHFMTGMNRVGTKTAEGFGKAGKFLNKLARSGSSTEREPVNEMDYICKVINLPLVEQTRITRISKRLADSKDKTEFWMPALPWRCIDYLNMKGCEEEGLYRVPGSGPKIKHWQTRFDRELDINLFEEKELYDPNIIGSMFKAWLRDLPDDILPQHIQDKIHRECAGATSTPQLLKDELSKLPPFNYYLLFAITCHISLLHSYSSVNKMDFRNLCICFQPCMKMNITCFQFLVCDWRNCWQGCWTEKEYLQKEYAILDNTPNTPFPPSSASSSKMSIPSISDDRALSSAGSSRPSLTGRAAPTGRSTPTSTTRLNETGSLTPDTKHRPPPLDQPPPRSTTSSATGFRDRDRDREFEREKRSRREREWDGRDESDTVTPTQSVQSYEQLKAHSRLPALSPMKPLSPIGGLESS